MSLTSLDYFRCEPFELNFRLHTFGGFWPLKTDVRWKQILFSIFSFLCYFSLVSMIVIQVVDIYLLRNDPVALTQDLSSISLSFTIVIKSVILLYKVDVINEMRENFTEYKNSRKNPSDIEILEKSNKQILMVIKTFYALTFPCVVFWILFPGLDSTEKRVPFPYRLPVEEWTFPIYVGVYVYHSMAMVGYMINTLAVDAMFCGFVLRINAHYDIVIKNVKSLINSQEVDNEENFEEQRETRTKLAKRVIKENVKLHQEILRQIKVFEQIYSSFCLVHFGGVILILGVAIIDFVRVAKGFKLQLLQKLLYVTVALWDSFLHCFFATKMQQKSSELSSVIYSVPWYHYKPEIKKDVMLIIFRCERTPKVRVAHLFPLNLQAFLKLLKISYDITALLFQTINE